MAPYRDDAGKGGGVMCDHCGCDGDETPCDSCSMIEAMQRKRRLQLLLEAALTWIERDEVAHGRTFGAGNIVREAIQLATGKRPQCLFDQTDDAGKGCRVMTCNCEIRTCELCTEPTPVCELTRCADCGCLFCYECIEWCGFEHDVRRGDNFCKGCQE